jgi:hypothetical protein
VFNFYLYPKLVSTFSTSVLKALLVILSGGKPKELIQFSKAPENSCIVFICCDFATIV